MLGNFLAMTKRPRTLFVGRDYADSGVIRLLESRQNDQHFLTYVKLLQGRMGKGDGAAPWERVLETSGSATQAKRDVLGHLRAVGHQL